MAESEMNKSSWQNPPAHTLQQAVNLFILCELIAERFARLTADKFQ
jgi:hypothetical protein